MAASTSRCDNIASSSSSRCLSSSSRCCNFHHKKKDNPPNTNVTKKQNAHLCTHFSQDNCVILRSLLSISLSMCPALALALKIFSLWSCNLFNISSPVAALSSAVRCVRSNLSPVAADRSTPVSAAFRCSRSVSFPSNAARSSLADMMNRLISAPQHQANVNHQTNFGVLSEPHETPRKKRNTNDTNVVPSRVNLLFETPRPSV